MHGSNAENPVHGLHVRLNHNAGGSSTRQMRQDCGPMQRSDETEDSHCKTASAKDPDLLSRVTLLEPQLSELRAWVQCLNQWNGRHMIVPPIDFRVQTDSSKKGWGAYAVLVK